MIKIVILFLIICYLIYSNKEGLKNCAKINNALPTPVKTLPYSNYDCHKEDFGDVKFCKKNKIYKEIKTLNKNKDELNDKIINVNRLFHNEYFDLSFNIHYEDEINALENSLKKYETIKNKYMETVDRYKKINEYIRDNDNKLNETNPELQQSYVDKMVINRKNRILS